MFFLRTLIVELLSVAECCCRWLLLCACALIRSIFSSSPYSYCAFLAAFFNRGKCILMAFLWVSNIKLWCMVYAKIETSFFYWENYRIFLESSPHVFITRIPFLIGKKEHYAQHPSMCRWDAMSIENRKLEPKNHRRRTQYGKTLAQNPLANQQNTHPTF